MKHIYAVLLLATAFSAAAAEEPKKPADFPVPLMCNGTYALCIKAPCSKTEDANHDVQCECVIQTGWNMGPAAISCDQRAQSLTSTYSNNFNNGSATVSCPQPQDWAWCYGASCARNTKHPNELAVCTCPVKHTLTVILTSAEKCPQVDQICDHMWSGAWPDASKFANDYYFGWMIKNHHPSEKPAAACAPPPGK
ncbi:MAG TPA: hypothetical protein VF381_01325 [Thermoanaerobaculia bacterium]